MFKRNKIDIYSVLQKIPFGNLYYYDFDFGKNEIVFQMQSKRQVIEMGFLML
ncbi:MAG: hypothetical protein K2K56_13540 [Lachnospiraceae bacterium]|nr:hypothetical protein [Lachnospiraceae bacterium]